MPGDDGGFEHLAAGPRIAADDGDPALATGGAEPTSGGRPEGQRQLRGQIGVGDTADSVGAKQSTHAPPRQTESVRAMSDRRARSRTNRAEDQRFEY